DSGAGSRDVDAASSICTSGGSCDTGNPCETGEIRCLQGMETCVGVGPATVGVACRPAAGPCDVAESCDGVSTTCPADSFAPMGESCTEDEESGTCNGLGADCVLGCFDGTPCSTGNACEIGEIDCSTGAPQCRAVGVVAEGTECRP